MRPLVFLTLGFRSHTHYLLAVNLIARENSATDQKKTVGGKMP